MLTAVAYVLTVLTNIQFNNTGIAYLKKIIACLFLERAKRYFLTSTKHLEVLRQSWNRAQWPIIERRYEEMADRLEIIVYEAIAPTFLITGHPEDCISHVNN